MHSVRKQSKRRHANICHIRLHTYMHTMTESKRGGDTCTCIAYVCRCMHTIGGYMSACHVLCCCRLRHTIGYMYHTTCIPSATLPHHLTSTHVSHHLTPTHVSRGRAAEQVTSTHVSHMSRVSDTYICITHVYTPKHVSMRSTYTHACIP